MKEIGRYIGIHVTLAQMKVGLALCGGQRFDSGLLIFPV
jgi:hypothetical protein